jgi:hypothetical protein
MHVSYVARGPVYSEMINTGLFSKNEELGEADDVEEDPEEHYGMGGAIERPDYGSEQLSFFTYISSSQLLPGILELIEGQAITQKFKLSLIGAISELLSVEELLANNNPLKVEYSKTNPMRVNLIEADIILWSTISDATKSDLQAFNALAFFKVVKKAYKSLQTRTIGPKRERMILTEMKTTLTSVNETNRKDLEQITPKKKGSWLKGIFGG